ncbi:MAG: aspartate carbamoyltransferase catalytic subunit [Chlamydiota bacterium]|nr:aspartate carbamoyltransferase catalytic subunit [Chlamydiota bacterium]
MSWSRKHLLGLEELERDEILTVLDTAESFKDISQRPIKKVPALQGKTVATVFYEPSTRTRTSFELAAKRLSADTLNITIGSSSVVKGESLKDTVKNLEALRADIIIIRHRFSGIALYLSKIFGGSIINAGDGSHEHPTQALIDLMTIRNKLGKIQGVRVGIVGDILHSRVARSNIWGMLKLGAEVTVIGPPTLIPMGIEKTGVKVRYHLDQSVLKELDVVMLLRIQLERQQKNLFPSLREYAELYGMSEQRFRNADKDFIIMHPGPINRGVELEDYVADGKHSVILEQVTNGLAVRMAVLYLVAGSEAVEQQ